MAKMEPRWAQDGPTMAQDGAEVGHDEPRGRQDGAKIGQDGPPEVAKTVQDGPTGREAALNNFPSTTVL